MQIGVLPIFLFAAVALALPIGMLVLGHMVGPRRSGAVKQMPYESGMDPIHDTRRRFDVRFHLVAIAFLIFDVELLFIYPWAVASGHVEGIDRAVAEGVIPCRGMVFAGVMLFLALVILGLIYEWRKGVLRWR
jgi:NADH-quinone oxidoreductase subunit A